MGVSVLWVWALVMTQNGALPDVSLVLNSSVNIHFSGGIYLLSKEHGPGRRAGVKGLSSFLLIT